MARMTCSWSLSGSSRTVWRVVTTGMRRFCKQADDIVARLAAIDAELVLEADGIDAVHVEEVDGAAVVADDPLADLELHLGRIVVAARDVVHRHRPKLSVRRMALHGGEKIGGEGRDPATSRNVAADDGDLRGIVQRLVRKWHVRPLPAQARPQ